MTKNYLINVVKSKMTLKVTYRNGRFLRIAYLSGKFDAFVILHLGAILPAYEKEIPNKQSEYTGKVSYSLEVKEVKQKSLYTQFVEEWTLFYEDYLGIAPKFTGADGNALKQIITYLKSINTDDEIATLNLWKLILSKWKDVNKFHQKNTDLKYINSRLNVIIKEIREQNSSTANPISVATSETARSFKFG
ncbi:hypothetical protein PL373_19735 [Tenacibaculum maritimum]|nr:hypothetical protein [Tenacibaculum maritimum]